MNTVDVVTPYSPKHTSKDLLERAKESVENQSVETNHIVVKDAEQKGVAWARNKGLEKSENRFVAFLDADDYWKSNKLEKQLQKIKKDDAGICITNTVDQKGNEAIPEFIKETGSTDSFVTQLVLGGITSLTSSITVDTARLDDLSFDNSLYRFEDHKFILDSIRISELAIVPETLTFIEKTESGLSNNTNAVLQTEARISVLEESKELFSSEYASVFDQALAVQYRWLAREKLRVGDSSDIVSNYKKSLSYYLLPKTLAAACIDLPRGVLS